MPPNATQQGVTPNPTAPPPAGFPQQQPAQAFPQPPAQQSPAQPTATNQQTTQRSLLFSELRDNMVIMADGSFRAIVTCESINFDLMSNREREGIEYSYQNFINSLYFDTQIFIRSKRVDIGPYLNKLVDIRNTQDNMLLGVLMDDYINFIDALAQEANIMDKSFFVVVQYAPTAPVDKIVEKGKGFIGNFFGQFVPKQAATVTKIDDATYQKAREEIGNRVDLVMNGLFQIGVRCAQLTTKELGELYYNIYNPDTAVNQPLGDFAQSTATYVRKAGGQAPQANPQEGYQ